KATPKMHPALIKPIANELTQESPSLFLSGLFRHLGEWDQGPISRSTHDAQSWDSMNPAKSPITSIRISSKTTQIKPMKVKTLILLGGIFAATLMAASPSANAQVQTTGTPGSPSATTTIDGKQIPPPDPKFGGVIKDTAVDSKPYWPPTVVPPKGAPNVLLIMTDDQGYGVYSTFGGVIPTPAMDRIAKAGLRYTQFHSTALCSPTRAALITGRNHHSSGFGVISEQATGYP